MVVSRRVRQGAVLGAVLLSLTMAGCGRRGRLEPAPDPNNPFALSIDKPAPADPAADADPAGAGDTKTRLGTHRRPKNPPIKPPNEPFILDPLL